MASPVISTMLIAALSVSTDALIRTGDTVAELKKLGRMSSLDHGRSQVSPYIKAKTGNTTEMAAQSKPPTAEMPQKRPNTTRTAEKKLFNALAAEKKLSNTSPRLPTSAAEVRPSAKTASENASRVSLMPHSHPNWKPAAHPHWWKVGQSADRLPTPAGVPLPLGLKVTLKPKKKTSSSNGAISSSDKMSTEPSAAAAASEPITEQAKPSKVMKKAAVATERKDHRLHDGTLALALINNLRQGGLVCFLIVAVMAFVGCRVNRSRAATKSRGPDPLDYIFKAQRLEQARNGARTDLKNTRPLSDLMRW
eukprot:TRINITY_DN96549_c0_g1_i1.p1 TRINITY_DN96549_c0_g1~~TRINITY_DN96549_c0_g1_i1.p1  ORF type:complete len:308 (+),score=67.70 TRINITY_DN96549_c0_g1_i1:110-1033(+)